MSTFEDRLMNERRHLTEGASLDEKPGGLGTVRFIAWCSGNPKQVLEKAEAVLMVVNENSAGEWPSDDKWHQLLPKWFIDRCGPIQTSEETDAELAKWKAMSSEEQLTWEHQNRWSLDNWIYWFMPENRHWFWWDATCLDDDALVVAVEVHAWPFPSGSLAWLLRAAGAEEVEAEK